MSRQPVNGAREGSCYFAQPYSIDAIGFYFDDLTTYSAKAAVHKDRFGMPVEEYEIQFIDGANYRLFDALQITQATLASWFETFADLAADDDDYLKAVYLAENGYDISQIPDLIEDVSFYDGSARRYAEEFVDECYEVPDQLEAYLDYDAIARDMRLNGDFTTMDTEEGEVLVFGP